MLLRRSAILTLLALPLLFTDTASFAARRARVVETTPVMRKLGSTDTLDILKTLSAGTVLQTSERSKDGYYKVLTPEGVMGFVAARALVFEEASKAPSSPPAPARTDPRFRVRALGGQSRYRAAELNQAFTSPAFEGGLHLGGDVAYALTPALRLVARFERFSHSAVLSDLNVDLQLASQQISGGLELKLFGSPDLNVSAAVYAGSANASLVATSATDAQDQTRYTGKSLQILATAAFHWYPWRALGLFAEGGYRSLKSPASAPTQTGSTSGANFKNGSSYISIPFDLSGPEFAGGIAIRF